MYPAFTLPDMHINGSTPPFSIWIPTISNRAYTGWISSTPISPAILSGNILGAGPLSDTSHLAFAAAREFLVSYLPIRDSLKKKYQRLDWLEKELQQGFRYIKYYFPEMPAASTG